MMNMLYESITYPLIGALMKVHNEVGPGLEESIYHEACKKALSNTGIKSISKPLVWVEHRGRRVKELIPDFLIEDCIILDLKSILGAFPGIFFSQVICYCKAFQKKLGILSNFGMQSLTWERIVYSEMPEDQRTFTEPGSIQNGPEASLFKDVITSLKDIWNIQGSGYNDDIYSSLFRVEMNDRKLHVIHKPQVSPEFQGAVIGKTTVPVYLVEGKCPVFITALHEMITATQLSRMRTYLKWLEHQSGIIVNFGKKECEVQVVSSR